MRRRRAASIAAGRSAARTAVRPPAPVTAGCPDATGATTSTAFVFALLIRWALGVALLMQTVAAIIADTARQKAPWRTAFNVAQYALSFGAAGATLWLFGVRPSPLHPLSVHVGALPGIVA